MTPPTGPSRADARAVKISRLRDADAFLERLDILGAQLPLDREVDPGGPLAGTLEVAGTRLANRFAVLPMEGWDGTPDGRPSDLVRRRWGRFAASGAGLVWGGEAYAVQAAGRANPRQLCINPESEADLCELNALLRAGDPQPFTGLQLTHSGRYARPEGPPAPRVAYRHPVLDARVGVDSDAVLMSDMELDDLIGDYVRVARLAERAGFGFVDVKACHGYLGHELLSARTRSGSYGGDLRGRSRFLRRTVEAVRSEAPSLAIGVRLSVFDLCPFEPGEDGIGRPLPDALRDARPFGASEDGLSFDLDEPLALVEMLEGAGVSLLCTTAGSPYSNPHCQRPAFYPPSDGYQPPEDPLVGVARQLDATRIVKQRFPDLCVVGSAYSYLQEWLPHVAQAVVREGGADLVGLGRMVLSYPELPRDVLGGAPLRRALVCRTFSDCTTAPRNGLVSGCYPIDPFYKQSRAAGALADAKARARAAAEPATG